MKKTTNTEKSPRPEWLFGGNPNAIEEQESKGQKEFVESTQLPRKTNSPREVKNTAEQYSKMGIEVFTTSKNDDIFLGVKLPKGWKKVETSHSMWNNLIDDKGRIRATIFYKAAFYDREAFINFNHRYYQTQEYIDVKNFDSKKKFMCVKDSSDNSIIFRTAETEEYYDSNLTNECLEFLNKNFPEHNDVNAYWN